jgi:lipopolysaccharide/colanic/teichoic acid biosynthesis glycosyltransferase
VSVPGYLTGLPQARPAPRVAGAGRDGAVRDGAVRAGRTVAAAGLPLADALTLGGVAAAAALAGWLGSGRPDSAWPGAGWLGGGSLGTGWPGNGWLGGGLLAGYLAVVFLALSASGLHRLRISLRVADQAGRIAAAALLPGIMLLPAVPAGPVLRLVLGTAAALIAVRVAGSAALRAARRRGLLTEPAVLAGAGPDARELARLLGEHPELGLRVRGFVAGPARPGSIVDGSGGAAAGRPLRVLGGPADLAAVVAREGISRVIVTDAGSGHSAAAGPGAAADLAGALRGARELGADVCVLPRLAGLGAAVPRGCLDEVWGIPLIPLRRPGPGRAGRLAKRAFDAASAAALLILTAPLLAAAGLAVRRRLRHPALFRQVRIVGPGRQAEIVKLRTLGQHGDPDTSWAVPAGRCGRLGRFLRVTHIDELPQLASVLRGDMSLVGPRPERPHFARQFAAAVPGYAGRHRMPAGLTGWAQVHGLNGDTSISDRARFDNYYIEYWSFWLDLLILARTVTSTAAEAARWAARPRGVPRAGPPARRAREPGIGLVPGPPARTPAPGGRS